MTKQNPETGPPMGVSEMQPWDVYGERFYPEAGVAFSDWMSIRSNRIPSSRIDFDRTHSSELGRLASSRVK